MNKWQFIAYFIMLFIAACEQEQIPVLALLWYALFKFCYGLSEFVGSIGISCEKNYYKAVKENIGG